MTRRWRPASQRGGGGAVGLRAVVASDSGEFAGSVAPVVPSGRDARKASSEAATAIAMTATTNPNVTIFGTRTHCMTLAGGPPPPFRKRSGDGPVRNALSYSKTIASLLILADGVPRPQPNPSLADDTVGLSLTACAIWLFVRALLAGSGPLGRGGNR
jgi:hypothetical protein